MDEAYRGALQAWHAEPEDSERIQALVAASRRAGAPLPEALDPAQAFGSLVEEAGEAYQLLDEAGYGHFVGGLLLPGGPSFAPERIVAAIDAVRAGEGDGGIAYAALRVSEVFPAEFPPFETGVSWSEGPPPAIAAAFDPLRARARALARTFRVAAYRVAADYPKRGQVYWDDTYLLYLPDFAQTYLYLAQYVW